MSNTRSLIASVYAGCYRKRKPTQHFSNLLGCDMLDAMLPQKVPHARERQSARLFWRRRDIQQCPNPGLVRETA